MKRVLVGILATVVAGCAPSPPLQRDVDPDILRELDAAASQKRDPKKSPLADSELMAPLRMEMPAVRGQPIDQRFDLSVSNAPAQQVFMSLVAGTRYSMLLNPNVGGTISVNLKDVTLREALQSLRELYGYEYSIDGSRIYIQPITIQTRIFQVNYLIGQRTGRTDVRVTSGSVADAPLTPTSGIPGVGGVPGGVVPGGGTPGAPGTAVPGVSDSSRIQTQTKSDFWDDLDRTLKAIVGAEPGRSVVVNPQAGVVMVRAMPAELRNVEGYLKAIRLAVERQVVLEAKIIEVTLNAQYQTGVNWAAFSANHVSAGQVSPGTVLQRNTGPSSALTTGSGTGSITGIPGNLSVTNPTFGANAGTNLINFGLPGASLFGLAIQASNFAALLTFLESQGSIQVLSSPRIATLNNQKAVLKVGTDQFFLTNISGSTTATAATTVGGTAVPAFPTITLRPFFSGVALDITPQIDDNSNIILHIHPSVSVVQTDNRQIDLGTSFGGVVSLPLAKSDVSETDSVVKIVDGAIVAIGGLMKVDSEDSRSGLPGAQDSPTVGGLFGSRNRTLLKKELVILIKPTVIQSGTESVEDTLQARERVLDIMVRPAPIVPQAGTPAR
jgi:MSHA biogenesis protein MshL